MVCERCDLLEKLLDRYSGYFDIARMPGEGESAFYAVAQFHSRSEQYVLVKSAKLWAAEAHEYAFFASQDSLGIPEWLALRDAALEEGLKLIKPHSEHMYSYITLIVLAGEVSPEAAKEIRRFRFHKNFRLSFYGWTDLRVAVVDGSTGEIITNAMGKDVKKTIAKIM